MYWRLRGMENALLDMASDPELATEMLSRCADFAIQVGEKASIDSRSIGSGPGTTSLARRR